jgi:NTP pyrophosphatase (non-canonical NTP hydrolase)
LDQVEEEDKELIVFHLLQLLQIVLLQVELLMEAVEAVEQPEQDLEHNQDKLADQVSLRLLSISHNLCQ